MKVAAKERTEGGREALGLYREKRDPVRGFGLGPNHDLSSNAPRIPLPKAGGGSGIEFPEWVSAMAGGKAAVGRM